MEKLGSMAPRFPAARGGSSSPISPCAIIPLPATSSLTRCGLTPSPRRGERTCPQWFRRCAPVLDSIELGSILSGALGCYELQLPPESRVDVEDAVRFVEDAESALRVGNRDVAVPAAATAANLARRPFLPAERGLWIERRRDDLRTTLLRALDVLAECLTGGPYEHDALRYTKDALALDPYRETSYVQLMRLHMSQGNRAEALRAYDRCRAILAHDLGVTPSSQTEAVYREVLVLTEYQARTGTRLRPLASVACRASRGRGCGPRMRRRRQRG